MSRSQLHKTPTKPIPSSQPCDATDDTEDIAAPEVAEVSDHTATDASGDTRHTATDVTGDTDRAAAETTEDANDDGSDLNALYLPSPRPRDKTRRSNTRHEDDRVALVSTASSAPISISELVKWTSVTACIGYTWKILDGYPVRLTDKLLQDRGFKCM